MLDGRGDNAGGGGGYGGGSGGGGYDQGYDSSPAPADPMVADRVHQTTWTTKSRSRINHHDTETKKSAEISALSF